MGLCGGSKHQKRAARAEAAKAKTNAGDGQPCPLGKCHLRVTVARADTGEGVENVTVAVTGPSPNTKQSVKDSGLADFGVVDPGQYKISLSLGAADAKKFAAAPEVQLNIAKGDTKAKRVELAPFVKLRVLLIDQKGKGLASADWDLSKPAKTGKTAADGLIEVDVPWDSDDDRKLKVKLPQPPAAPPAPAPAAAPPPAVPAPYPPAVVAADFSDDAPPAFAPESDVDWTVSLADLADGDDDDGVKARLNNLGFIVDSKDNVKRAVQAYQKQYLNQDNGSGVLKDILADIKTRHDTSP